MKNIMICGLWTLLFMLTGLMFAQQKVVKGIVVDATGMPMAGYRYN